MLSLSPAPNLEEIGPSLMMQVEKMEGPRELHSFGSHHKLQEAGRRLAQVASADDLLRGEFLCKRKPCHSVTLIAVRQPAINDICSNCQNGQHMLCFSNDVSKTTLVAMFISHLSKIEAVCDVIQKCAKIPLEPALANASIERRDCCV